MLKHILLPTDGSELSAAAVKEAVRLAKSLGAKLTGLHVIPMQHTFFYQARISKKALKGVDQKFRWTKKLQSAFARQRDSKSADPLQDPGAGVSWNMRAAREAEGPQNSSSANLSRV